MKKIAPLTYIFWLLASISYAQQIVQLPNPIPNLNSTLVSVALDSKSYKTPEKNEIAARIEILPSNDTAMVYKHSIDSHEEIALGTPYFKNGIFDTDRLNVDGSVVSGSILYDISTQKIQFSADNFKTSNVISPEKFEIANHKFLKLNNLYSNANKNYYEEIYNDDFNQIFKIHYCDFKAIQIPKSIQTNNDELIIGEFKKSAEYYIIKVNRLERLKKSMNFCKQIGLFEKDLEWFAETKKLSFDNDRDIIEIMKYYNTLYNENLKK